MRLLDAWLLIHEGIAELVNFPDERSLPPYAALSHTWAEEEVLFEDVPLGPNHELSTSSSALRASSRRNQSDTTKSNGTSRSEPHVKAGWNKVLNTCLQACRDGFDYVWIDTCCIDKASSAELSEAINSMWRWYRIADICYVYLADCTLSLDSRGRALIPVPEHRRRYFSTHYKELELNDELRRQFQGCRWFTRGWTLQELIAPKMVHFFDMVWQFVATKSQIVPDLSSITGIHLEALENKQDIAKFSIAQRMFWASKRQTTRVEDEAYCLLGIFGINMPLLYGEGRRAFVRMQEHIFSSSTDKSILAWELRPDVESDLRHAYDIFAPSAANFWWHARDITSSSVTIEPEVYQLTNQGIQLPLALDSWREGYHFNISIAHLDCDIRPQSVDSTCVGLRLRKRYDPTRKGANARSLVYAQVAVEMVSTIEEPEPAIRRLGKTSVRNPKLDVSLSVLLLREKGAGVPLYRGIGTHPVSPLQAQFGIGEIKLCLPHVHSNRSKWRVTDAHPSAQFHALNGVLTLPIVPGSVHAAVTIESTDRLRCTVLVGLVHVLENTVPGSLFGRGYCQYWIFPGPLKSRRWNRWVYGVPRADQLQKCERLCRDASSFASKDFFEGSTRRLEANKFILLPGDKRLRVSLERPKLSVVGRQDKKRPKVELTLQLSEEEGTAQSEASLAQLAGLRVHSSREQPFSEQFKLINSGVDMEATGRACWQFCESRRLGLPDFSTGLYFGRPGVDGFVPRPPGRLQDENIQ